MASFLAAAASVGKLRNHCESPMPGARLPNLVGAVESCACDDVSGHGVECIGEAELVGQVELVVEGKELENVGAWSVRARGLGAGPAAAAEGAFTVFEAKDRAGVGEAVLGNAA